MLYMCVDLHVPGGTEILKVSIQRRFQVMTTAVPATHRGLRHLAASNKLLLLMCVYTVHTVSSILNLVRILRPLHHAGPTMHAVSY